MNKRYPRFRDFLNEADSNAKWTSQGVPKKRREDPDFDFQHTYDKDTGELVGIMGIEKNMVDRDKYIDSKFALATELMMEFESQVRVLKDLTQRLSEMKKIEGLKKTELIQTMYKIVGMNPNIVHKKPEDTNAKERVGIIIETLNVSANLTGKLLTPETTSTIPDYEKALDNIKEIYKDNKEILLTIDLEIEKSKKTVTKKGLARKESFGGSGLKINKTQIERRSSKDIDDMFDDVLDEGIISDTYEFFRELYLVLRRKVSKIDQKIEEAKRIVDDLK